jgi:hypothetical protein
MEASGQLYAPAALTPKLEHPRPIELEGGSVSVLVCVFRRREKCLDSAEIGLCFLGRPDHSVVTIPTTLSQLPLLLRMVPKCYPVHLVSRLIQLYNILDLLAVLCMQWKSQRAQQLLYTIQCFE